MKPSEKSLRFALLTVLIGMFFVCVTVSSRARAAEVPSVRANYAAFSGAFAPLWIAADRNLFTKYGLNVDIRYIAPATATQALHRQEPRHHQSRRRDRRSRIERRAGRLYRRHYESRGDVDLCETGNRFASRSEGQGVGRDCAGGHHRLCRAGFAPAGALDAG